MIVMHEWILGDFSMLIDETQRLDNAQIELYWLVWPLMKNGNSGELCGKIAQYKSDESIKSLKIIL